MGSTLDRRHAIALAAGAFAGMATPTLAQSAYPNHPIRIVVPVPPGGAFDLVIRPLGQRVQPVLGQPFILDNKPGAASMLGAQLVARAPADGYTLLLANDVPFSIMPALGMPMPFDPDRDFVPLSMLSQVSLFLITAAGFPAANVREFIAYVKANPGKATYSTGGVGTPHHVAMERLMVNAGMDMLHVPYQGIAPAFNGLLAGDVNVMLVALTVASEHIKSGRLKALAFTGPQRHPKAPGVPTFRESGFPDYVVSALFALFAPAGTPPEITRRLSGAVWDTVSSDEFNDNVLLPGGFDPHPSVPPDKLPAFIREERRKWRDALAKIDPRKFVP
ncbi:MAG: tripartite tricarboxylate transporter substrate binding protein [Pseudomonadota bacterium]